MACEGDRGGAEKTIRESTDRSQNRGLKKTFERRNCVHQLGLKNG
jgi:hypothetical protein